MWVPVPLCVYKGQRITVCSLFFSHFYMGSSDQNQVARLHHKCLYQLSHLADLCIFFQSLFHRPGLDSASWDFLSSQILKPSPHSSLDLKAFPHSFHYCFLGLLNSFHFKSYCAFEAIILRLLLIQYTTLFTL